MVELRKVNNLSEMIFYFIICQTDHSPPKTLSLSENRYEMNMSTYSIQEMNMASGNF